MMAAIKGGLLEVLVVEGDKLDFIAVGVTTVVFIADIGLEGRRGFTFQGDFRVMLLFKKHLLNASSRVLAKLSFTLNQLFL
jgi:hypothetical protein